MVLRRHIIKVLELDEMIHWRSKLEIFSRSEFWNCSASVFQILSSQVWIARCLSRNDEIRSLRIWCENIGSLAPPTKSLFLTCYGTGCTGWNEGWITSVYYIVLTSLHIGRDSQMATLRGYRATYPFGTALLSKPFVGGGNCWKCAWNWMAKFGGPFLRKWKMWNTYT